MPRTDLHLALASLRTSHDEILHLCDELEAIADSLPSNIDRQQCLHVARSVCRTVAEAHRLEESLLFPAVEPLSMTLKTMPATLERLRFEHYEDMCFAEELADTLLALGRSENRLSGDATGYMLRGFFESVRRHVAFERELLTPLLEMSWSTVPERHAVA
jgi:hemerythrin-like domain-containing protein